MKFSLLFWGFQDLNFVSEVAKKARFSLGIKDFYIQINDLEKTISLLDLYPEEIIRTKYDLSNLYQWLKRSAKKNIFVLVDLFTLVFQDNFEENCLSLKKILNLGFKVSFLTPKILHPQSLKFLKNHELNSIYQKTVEYTQNVKSLYEIIINSGLSAHIISAPVSEIIMLNREEYFLFEEKNKYHFIFIPKILRQFNTTYISQKSLAGKLVEAMGSILSLTDDSNKLLFINIEADCSTNYLNLENNFFKKFKPVLSISLERFFKVKNSTPELKFILWLMYLAICENEIQVEKSSAEPMLSELFFSSQSS